MENLSFFLINIAHLSVSVFIIIIVLVFYSRTKHQGLIFILVAEIINIGWSAFSFISWVFILPIVNEPFSLVKLANY